jgi:hypothetical protein
MMRSRRRMKKKKKKKKKKKSRRRGRKIKIRKRKSSFLKLKNIKKGPKNTSNFKDNHTVVAGTPSVATTAALSAPSTGGGSLSGFRFRPFLCSRERVCVSV